VVAGVRRQLRWLLIDEFQDTDPAQRDIAYRICGLDGDPTPGAPSLCIVGDPKQSIYRFRRADVAVWNAVADDFAHLGSPPIPLDTNYRSRTPIVGFVNTVFGPLMDAVVAPHEVRYRALRAHREYAGDDALIEWLRIPEGSKADERRRIESDAVVERIRRLVTSGETCIRDEADKEPRAATWKDIALLFRTRTAVGIYQDALRRGGIPFYLSSGTGFFARQEVQDVRLLLAALAAPHDDLAWAGLLRSPWVGLADESLLRLRMAKPGPFSAALDVPLPGDEGPRLAHAREWLRQLAFLRDRVSAAVLVERALDASGYAEHLLLDPGGDLALANLRKAVSMAAGVPGQSLAEIVAFFDERADAAERESDAALHTGGENVVVLSTVHGAKGLEWPVVFLCDLDREVDKNPNPPRLRFDPEVGVALKPEGDEPAEVWNQLCERDVRVTRAEEKRLWYVAATRARDRLVLCGMQPTRAETPDGGDKPLAWLLHGTEQGGESFRYTAATGASWTGTIHAPAAEDLAIQAARSLPRLEEIVSAPAPDGLRLDRLQALGPPTSQRRHSASSLMSIGKPVEPLRRTRTGSTGAPDARTTGNILHAVMQHLRDGDDLDAILDREIEAEIGTDVPSEWRQALRTLIENARAHDFVARMHGATHSERELAFTWFADVDGEPAHLEGVIDLAALVGGVPEVLDYKSHDLAPGEESGAAEGYTLQAELYAAALGELLGAAPAAFRFLFPRTGGEVRMDLPAERRAAFREQLAVLLRNVSPTA
jgi:ATP-dependent helicase/nuclease subunit A